MFVTLKPLDCSMWLFSYTVAVFFGGFAMVGDVVMFWNHMQWAMNICGSFIGTCDFMWFQN